MAYRSRIMKNGRPILVEDVSISQLRHYVTISELLDQCEAAGLPRYDKSTIRHWIAAGHLPARKAGSGQSVAFLIHRDAARSFIEFMRARNSGDVLGTNEAADYLGRALGKDGPVSPNTIRTWIYRGLLFPINPAVDPPRFALTELDAFAEWYHKVARRAYGKVRLPGNAERPYWIEDSD